VSTIDFKQLSAQLLQQAENILLDICPGGKRNGREYQASTTGGGHGSSFCFNLHTGVWKDFATGEGGQDLIALYAHNNRINMKESAEHLQQTYIGQSRELIKSPQAKPMVKKIEPKPIKPPVNISPPSFTHFQLGNPSMVHEYKDINGDLLYYILRYETKDDEGNPSKEHRPLSYFDDGTWQWKAWKKNRPLYGLENLPTSTDKLAIIVEGEKSADAARKFINKYQIITWSGGSKATNKTDWTPLKDYEVILWPDADVAGIEAMADIKTILKPIVKTLKVIIPDRDDSWDAADALQDGWTHEKFIQWARSNIKIEQDPNNEIVTKRNNLNINRALIVDNYPMKNSDDNPENTIQNFEYLLSQYRVIVRNNLLTKKEEILIPTESFHEENKENAQLAWIKSLCAGHKFSLGQVEEYLKYIANKNQYNPVVTWVTSTPWDKHERLKDFYNTVKAKDEDTNSDIKRLKETFIRRWMISAIAAVFRPNGVSAHGVLVFQGLQGSGKTYWFKKLVPEETKFAKDGVTLKTEDKDSIMQALSFWLVELGEVDSTFRKSDISSLKAFITKDSDTFRAPFARRESTYARRTVFFASVNPRQFLHDETGNRRFWTIECDEIDYKHTFDMQQIWAELYENHYLKGESWILNDVESLELNALNEDFKSLDPIEERVLEELEWSEDQSKWTYKTATQVLLDMGHSKPMPKEVATVSRVIFTKNGGRKKKTEGLMKLLVPNRRIEKQFSAEN